MTSANWLLNFHSFFSCGFLSAKESEIYSLQLLQSFSPVISEFSIQSCLFVLWKYLEMPKDQMLFRHLRYIKVLGKKKELQTFWRNTKNEFFQHKISLTQYLRRSSRHWWKVAKLILLGVFSSTAQSHMIITNILKTKNLEEQ